MTGPVALITGASSGIGADLARVFAANGHRVALVARRQDRLHILAAEIIAAGGPPPLVIPCDLAKPDACDEIAEALGGARVEYLVNNAGFGLVGSAAQLGRAEQLELIDLNVRALCDLTLRFMPQLIRHCGGILNVASIVAFMPGPGMATYAASKAFVLSFTESLHAELKPHGVRVCALCPGPVPSGFQERAGMRADMRVTPLDVSSAQVAREGYRGLMRGHRLVLPGGRLRLMSVLVRLMPRQAMLAIMARMPLRR